MVIVFGFIEFTTEYDPVGVRSFEGIRGIGGVGGWGKKGRRYACGLVSFCTSRSSRTLQQVSFLPGLTKRPCRAAFPFWLTGAPPLPARNTYSQSCSGSNTQTWIAGLAEKQPWTVDYLERQGDARGSAMNLTHNAQDLQSFIKYAINNDKTEICAAQCKGDFRTPILIYTISFVWELVVVVCAAVAMIAAGAQGGHASGGGAMGLVLCGFCTIFLLLISASIAVTVRSAEAGCWGFYVQDPCREPNVLTGAVTKDGLTYIANETWCPMMWWHCEYDQGEAGCGRRRGGVGWGGVGWVGAGETRGEALPHGGKGSAASLFPFARRGRRSRG